MNATVCAAVVDPDVWGDVLVCCGMNVTACAPAPAPPCKEAWLRLATCEAGIVRESVVGVSESD